MSSNPVSDNTTLRGPVPLSHLIMRCFVREGCHVIDATCGNGHDTLLLAELVGRSGRVWAFDIQEEALVTTAQRIEAAGLAGRVSLIHDSHERISSHVPVSPSAVVFNLGYRPGGDRGIITRHHTTLAALQEALQLVLPNGIVAVTIYPGHEGGAQEQEAVDAWASRLEPRCWHVWRMGQYNVTADAPYLILIQKGF